jgi:hypothetical protein
VIYKAALMDVPLSAVQTSVLNRSSRLVYTHLFVVNHPSLASLHGSAVQIEPTSVGPVIDICLNWLHVRVYSAVKYTFNSRNFTRVGAIHKTVFL